MSTLSIQPSDPSIDVLFVSDRPLWPVDQGYKVHGLSMARALSVVDLLTQAGFPASRVVAAGFGEHQPLDTSGTEEANRRNRRIELKLTQP